MFSMLIALVCYQKSKKNNNKKAAGPATCSGRASSSTVVTGPDMNSSNNNSTPWPVVPGGRAFVGNTIPGGFQNTTAVFEDWASKHGENGIFGCNIMGQKLIVLCSDETISALEEYRPYHITRRSSTSRVMESVGAAGIFSAEGEQWSRERRLVGPALNRKNVKDYVAMAKLVASRVVRKWQESIDAEDDGKVVVANRDLLCYSIDIISLVVFATDVDSLRTGEMGVCYTIQNILKRSMVRIFAPFPYWKIPLVGQYLDGCGMYIQRAKRNIRRIIDEHESSLKEADAHNHNDKDNHNKRNRKSFLGKLLALAEKEDVPLSEDRVIGNLLTMFAAGSETTYNTILVCLYELALDKTKGGWLQDEISEEVSAMLANASSSNNSSSYEPNDENYDADAAAFAAIDLDRLNQGLPRTRSLLYEVLRLKGPSPLMNGESLTEVNINGVVIPARTQFLQLTRYASRVETQWSVQNNRCLPRGPRNAPPSEFCPRRWLVPTTEATSSSTESSSSPTNTNANTSTPTKARITNTTVRVIKPTHKMGFRPFGSSVRVCPGRDLAEMEALVLLSSVLRKFEIRLDGGRLHAPLEFATRVTYQPNIDIRLALRLR